MSIRHIRKSHADDVDHRSAYDFAKRLDDFVQAKTPSGVIFENFMMGVIMLNVLNLVLHTVPQFKVDPTWQSYEYWTEWISTILFTMEYCLRLYAARSIPKFVFSFFGIVDFLAIAPFYVGLAYPRTKVIPTTAIRLVRLMRLLRSPAQIEAAQVFRDMLDQNSTLLLTTGYVALVGWVWCSTALHYAERDDETYTDDFTNQATRFRSVPSSMWYTFILLSGDYPLIDFTLWGRLICFIMIMIAVGLVSIPSGIFASGFEEIAQRRRDAKIRDQVLARMNPWDRVRFFVLGHRVINHLLQDQREATKAAKQALRQAALEKADARKNPNANNGFDGEMKGLGPDVASGPNYGGVESKLDESDSDDDILPLLSDAEYADLSLQSKAAIFFFHGEQQHSWAKLYNRFLSMVVFGNIGIAFAGTLPSPTPVVSSHTVYSFELVGATIFLVDYIFRIWAAPSNPTAKSHDSTECRFNYIKSWLGIFDLASWFPFFLCAVFLPTYVTTSYWAVFRILRHLVQDPTFAHALGSFRGIWVENKSTFITTGYIGLLTWMICGFFFYYAEKDNPVMEGRFTSIPRACWYTLIMLQGEYPQNDFTMWGRVVGSFVTIVAVGIVAVPTGILGAAFMNTVEDEDDDEEAAETDEDFLENAPDEPRCISCRIKYAEARGTRRRIYLFAAADTMSGKTFLNLVIALVIINCVCFVLGTDDDFVQAFPQLVVWFPAIETFSVAVYTLEYVLRMYAIVEKQSFQEPSPFIGRLRYACSFFALIDLVSIAPFYLLLLLQPAEESTLFLWLNALVLIRLLKLEKKVEALTLLDDVYRRTKKHLQITGLVSLVMWIFLAAMMYFAHNDGQAWGDTENRYGESAPDSMWYTLLNLTGEFPMGDFSNVGKVWGLFLCIFAIGVFGNFAGIMSGGFSDIVEDRLRKEEQLQRVNIKCHDCSSLIEHFYWLDPDEFI